MSGDSDDSMKKVREPAEPTQAALEELPEIIELRFRRRPGRGHHAHRRSGEIVAIDAELGSRSGPPKL